MSRFVLNPYDKREAISLPEAAKKAGRSESTMRTWCAQYQIGRRVAGGNWQISRVALQMLLDGEMEALAKYGAGKKTSPDVVVYFKSAGLDNLISSGASNGQ